MSWGAIRQSGFTLIELMISMVLGLLLVLAASSIVISSLSQVKNTESFAEVIDNARIAMATMGQDISHAGFLADLTGSYLEPGANLDLTDAPTIASDCRGGGVNNESFPIVASDGTFRMLWGETMSGSTAMGCISSAMPDSDIIQIKRLIGREDPSVPGTSSNRVYMVVTPLEGILFDGGAAAPVLANGKYFEYQHRIYYIGKEDRYGVSNFPVLRRKHLNDHEMLSEEIAEGVEELRILYGIDDSGSGNVERYVPAAQVTDDEWDGVGHPRILSIQLSMLVRSVFVDRSFKSAGSATYTLGDKTVTKAADGIRRKVITSTITLPNYQFSSGGL